ncbi:MAG: 5-formyltetrahydrofolate cyclo-ligase [Candidatus Aenigmarchaeota archaeon]|nr:5-formyltetrahydrofolate cyclo-ligase [Candidatus Aenigmarchaeota archaeon]
MNFKRDKRRIREQIWNRMKKEGIAPPSRPVFERIPSFVGMDKAAENLRKLGVYKKANVIFVNPDTPQRKVRENALKDGKIVIMPTPRLKQNFFLLLDPEDVKGMERQASTIKGAFKYGKRIKIEDLPNIDLKVQGSVGVASDGTRLGKGGGYGDKEFAMLKMTGKINEKTPLVTTVHEVQIVEKIPRESHDIIVDYIVTPENIIKTDKS